MHQLLLILFCLIGFLTSEILIDVTPKSFAHIFKKEMSNLHDNLLRLRPSPFQSTYLGLELTIDNLQIVDLKMPRITYEISSSPDIINIKLLGGSARLLGQYNAIYKTKREGQFELSMDHFHFNMPVMRSGTAKLTPIGTCSLEVDEAIVTMKPSIPEQITQMVKSNILEKIQKSACFHAISFLSKVNSKISKGFEMMDISEGNHPSKIDVDVRYHDKNEEDTTGIDIMITESIINGELSKLYSSANTRILWNNVPEIKRKLEECEENECRIMEDGDIHSILHGKPTIHISNDNQLSLNLPLSTTLTRGRNELIKVLSDINIKITDITIDPIEDGYIPWSAKYRVESIQILQTSSSRNFQKFASTIEQWMNDNTHFIENLLSTYLQGHLPIHIKSPISWYHSVHATPDSSKNALSFRVHPHFSPSLRIIS